MDSLKIIWDAVPTLLLGVVETFRLSLLSILLGCVWGLVAGLMRTSGRPVLARLAVVYVEIIRGTPLLVQVFFVYFGVPTLLHQRVDPLVAAVASVSVNAGAYIAEILRAGIESIDKGQVEAARSLGMTANMAMRLVVLPQALRRVIPPLVNQFIITIKDTSLLSVIGLEELTRKGQLVIAVNFRAFQIWAAVAVLYLVMIFLLSRLSIWVERRLVRS